MKKLKSSLVFRIAVIILIGCFCACSSPIQDQIKFPDSLSDLSVIEQDANIAIDSSLIDMNAPGLVCNKWIGRYTAKCGLIKDCDNITFAEAKHIGDALAKRAITDTKNICKAINCPVTQYRNIKWSKHNCKNRRLCIGLYYEFRCKLN